MGWGLWPILFATLLLLTPAVQLGVAWERRRRARRRFEERCLCRVFPLVLSMGTVATYGLPLTRFEELPLPQEVAAWVAATPAGVTLYLLADLPARVDFDPAPVVAALAERAGPATLVVPRRALAGGLALARACGEVLLGPAALVADSTRSEAATDPASEPGGDAATADGAPAPVEPEWRLAALDAQGLRRLGLTVREELPDGLDELLAAFPEPHRPRRRPPFYLGLPRSAQPSDTHHRVVAGGIGPDDGAPGAADRA